MWRPFSVFSRMHKSPQCRCSDFPQAGMKPDPCRGRRGGRSSEEAGDAGLETRRTETRGHAGRRRGSTQDGDTGTRRTETREHAGRRHGDTQDGDTGTRRLETRRSETRKHAGRRRGSTQDGDAGTRRTEMREHAGRRRGNAETQMGLQSGKTAAKSGRAPPCLASSRDSARCVHYKQRARSRKRPGPVLIYRAATLRQQQAPRLRQPTHTTCNRCTHRQVRHMQQAQRRQAPKRLPTPRRTRA